jgi:hypothetical protein
MTNINLALHVQILPTLKKQKHMKTNTSQYTFYDSLRNYYNADKLVPGRYLSKIPSYGN